jgi:hypothetical protein
VPLAQCLLLRLLEQAAESFNKAGLYFMWVFIYTDTPTYLDRSGPKCGVDAVSGTRMDGCHFGPFDGARVGYDGVRDWAGYYRAHSLHLGLRFYSRFPRLMIKKGC